ncbi:MAG TPA: hypothetical protein VLG50_04230 [Candidatus Saccharimonadales bacterium]|nr:hypothetical protein [Candidatus Saccharimonadales bacterium]
MNKKISLIMLFGLSLNIAQQFFASVQNDPVTVCLRNFQEIQKREELQCVRYNYDRTTKMLVQLGALQKMLEEKKITKVGQFSLEPGHGTTQISIGFGRVWVEEDLCARIRKVIDEEELEATCCFPRSYPRYGKDCDLSVVFARVQSDLEASRKPYEDFLKSQSNNQSDNQQRT